MASTAGFIFVGLAEHIELPSAIAPPVGAVDVFKLSVVRQMIFYPVNIRNLQWLFLVNVDLLRTAGALPRIGIVGEDGHEVGRNTFTITQPGTGQGAAAAARNGNAEGLWIPEKLDWVLMHFTVDTLIPKPGTYRLTVSAEDEEVTVGVVQFAYVESPPLTGDQIKAIESDPYSSSAVRLQMKCSRCAEEMKAYAATSRSRELEADGFIQQHDLPERFRCQCGQVDWPLQMIRESLHGVLGRESMRTMAGVSYGRRYGHVEIAKTVTAFMKLVDEQDSERPIHKFIETNPVILAQFHAAKLMSELPILGKRRPDFVILDTKGRLLLIELERPSLPLFKKDGHLRAELTHAYEQVNDWFDEYRKHPGAVLDGMNIKPEEVTSVRGVVIAGRLRDVDQDHLRRHLSGSSFPNIEFMTLDDLARSVLQISRRLA